MALSDEHSPGSPGNSAANAPPGAPVPEPAPAVLNQDLVNELIAAQLGRPSSLLDDQPLGKGDALLDNSPIVQRDEEELLAPVSNDLLAEVSSSDKGRPLTQDDIDHYIADQVRKQAQGAPSDFSPSGPGTDSTDSPAAPESELSPEELERLVSQLGVFADKPKADSSVAPSGVMSQDELDRLFAQTASPSVQTASEKAPPPVEPTPDGSMSQEELDRLMTQTPPPPSTRIPKEENVRMDSGMPASGVMSQEELDRLFAQASAASAPPTPPVKTPPAAVPTVGDVMSQDELDQLFAQASEASAPATPPAITPPAAAPTTGDVMSQEELDQLFAQAASHQTPEASIPVPAVPPEALVPMTNMPEPAAPQETPQPPGGSAPLDQAALDDLLAQLQAGEATPAGVTDTPGVEASAPFLPVPPSDAETSAAAVSLSQSDLDDLIAGFEQGAAAPAPAAASQPAALSENITQDMIEALISAASAAESPDTASVGSENLAAAATSPAPILETTPAGVLLETAKTKKEMPPQLDMETAEVAAAAPVKPRRSFKGKLLRTGMSLAAGLLVGFGTFSALYLNREQTPELPAPEENVHAATPATTPGEHGISLPQAMEQAKSFIAAKEYKRAIAVLKDPMEKTKQGEEYTEARYLVLEARYKGFDYQPDSPEYQELHTAIDAIASDNPTHPRTLDALHWKAKLYEMDSMPYAANDVYKQIIERFAGAPSLDMVLLDAAKMANSLRNPQEAAEYAQHLLKEYPGSAQASETHLVLGDAYAMAGMEDDARTLFVRLADKEPSSPRGSQAFLRLGRLAMDQKNYDSAINHLKTCLQTSAAQEGNDAVYLLLAQAYRGKGQLDDARATLNDLIKFFPNAPSVASALVEQSQLAETQGNRQEAMNLAQQAVSRFPKNPLVLKNYGEFLGLDGNPYGAAATLMAADEAGANDPNVLMAAARHFKTLAMNEQARKAYAKVKAEYPKSPEALTAAIEEAQIMYAMDKVNDAVQQLRQLAETHGSAEERLPVWMALAHVYRDLGLTEAAAGIARDIAAEATEPEPLAEAAVDLLHAGALEEALPIIARVDAAKLGHTAAYTLLMEFGKALLNVDPNRALEKLESAYLTYPDARNPEDEQTLLEAYIASNRTAAARRIVMEKAAQAHNAPAETPYMIDAAITWADFLYAKGDYREAAEAYSMAIQAAQVSTFTGKGIKTDPLWAKYQRANALLELADFSESLSLYKDLAASDSPWAKEAGMKAAYAELEQRLRGVIPANESAATPKQEG